jgi:hypothetical protein
MQVRSRAAGVFWRDLQAGAEFGSYIADVVDKCVGRRLPGLAFGKLAAALRRQIERRLARQAQISN